MRSGLGAARRWRAVGCGVRGGDCGWRRCALRARDCDRRRMRSVYSFQLVVGCVVCARERMCVARSGARGSVVVLVSDLLWACVVCRGAASSGARVCCVRTGGLHIWRMRLLRGLRVQCALTKRLPLHMHSMVWRARELFDSASCRPYAMIRGLAIA